MKAVFGAVQAWLLQMLWLDPDETAYAAHITVWTRWFLWVGAMVSLALRPTFMYPQSIPFLILHVALVTLNGWVHYRLVSRRSVTWRHVFALSALDITFVTATVVDGGYDTFWFVAHYAALAAFAAVFTSPLLNLTWTAIAAFLYVGVSLTVGSGMALDGIDGKALYVRVVGMFGVVLAINFITRFQRHRARAAMERERELQRERLELSETIHDTAAQTAFMIGLGIARPNRLPKTRTRSSPPGSMRPHGYPRPPSGS